MSTDKKILLDTVKEYSGHTTIHGLNYIFASFLTLPDRIFWLVIFLFGIVFSVYLSIDAFVDWRKNMIITRFENSELPVTEIAFPAVTICNQGLNMDYVAMAVERDFYEWHKAHAGKGGGREKRNTLEDMMAVYLKEKFDINRGDPSILEIIQSTTSTGGASAMVAEALTKNAKKCSEKEAEESDKESPEVVGGSGGEPPEKVEGSECPLMRGFTLQSGEEVAVGGGRGQPGQEEEEWLEEEEEGESVLFQENYNRDNKDKETTISGIANGLESKQGEKVVNVTAGDTTRGKVIVDTMNMKKDGASVVILEGLSLAECSRECHFSHTCVGFSFRWCETQFLRLFTTSFLDFLALPTTLPVMDSIQENVKTSPKEIMTHALTAFAGTLLQIIGTGVHKIVSKTPTQVTQPL